MGIALTKMATQDLEANDHHTYCYNVSYDEVMDSKTRCTTISKSYKE